MKTHIHTLATAIIISLVGGASGLAMAEAIETQHSAYHLAAQFDAAPGQAGQAGPAGPGEIPGRGRAMSDQVPVETMYSADHMAARFAAQPAAQAGRAGPVSIGPTVERSQVFETLHSAYELNDRP